RPFLSLVYNRSVERLRRDELDRASAVPSNVRAAQALDMMATGIRLKRVALRNRHSDAAEGEIDRMLRAWLLQRD
ncbi:MAG: hypothetical protein ACI9WU_004371, partial [Myxococcota bacterium]